MCCAELLTALKSDLATLEKMLKSMDDYLETKRMLFPRLYFLSTAELVELMSKKDHNAVQASPLPAWQLCSMLATCAPDLL